MISSCIPSIFGPLSMVVHTFDHTYWWKVYGCSPYQIKFYMSCKFHSKIVPHEPSQINSFHISAPPTWIFNSFKLCWISFCIFNEILNPTNIVIAIYSWCINICSQCLKRNLLKVSHIIDKVKFNFDPWNDM